MKFQKKSGAKIHKQSENGERLYNLNGKCLTAKQKQILLLNKIVDKRTSFICKPCLDFGISECGVDEEISDDNMDWVGELINDIDMDIKSLRQEELDFANLEDFDVRSWLKKRPSKLISFMKRLCKITDVSSDNDYSKLGLVIELIYGCWSPNIVLPMSFLKNLICHRTTRSKKNGESTIKSVTSRLLHLHIELGSKGVCFSEIDTVG